MEYIKYNINKNDKLKLFYKNYLFKKYKIYFEKNKDYLELIYLSFILQKHNNIIQLGIINDNLINFILNFIDKSNYKIIKYNYNKKIFHLFNYKNNFNLNFNYSNFNNYVFKEEILIIGNLRQSYEILTNSDLLKNIKFIYVCYFLNNNKYNINIRNLLINNNFYTIGKKLLDDNKFIDKSLRIKKDYTIIEIFSKGQILGIDYIKDINNLNRDIKFNRTYIINYLIKKYNLKNYLEIGVRNGKNFNNIIIKNKIGVDPEPIDKIKDYKNIKVMTSDNYFISNNIKFDIIFIDGLHLEEQVDKDIINSLKVLNDNGYIIMHDCNPPTKFHQRTNYELKNGETPFWNGTVWRSYVKLRMNNNNLKMRVVNCDWGVGIIQKGNQKCIKTKDLKYNLLNEDRENILNLISPYEFLNNF